MMHKYFKSILLGCYIGAGLNGVAMLAITAGVQSHIGTFLTAVAIWLIFLSICLFLQEMCQEIGEENVC